MNWAVVRRVAVQAIKLVLQHELLLIGHNQLYRAWSKKSLVYIYILTPIRKSKSKFYYDRWSVGQSVLEQGCNLGRATNFSPSVFKYVQTFTGLLMWASSLTRDRVCTCQLLGIASAVPRDSRALSWCLLEREREREREREKAEGGSERHYIRVGSRKQYIRYRRFLDSAR
jgi:hypothetical protein